MKTPLTIYPSFSALILSMAFSGLGALALAQTTNDTSAGAVIVVSNPLTGSNSQTTSSIGSGGTLSLGTSYGASITTGAGYSILTAAAMGTDSTVATALKLGSLGTASGITGGTLTIGASTSTTTQGYGTLSLGGLTSVSNILTSATMGTGSTVATALNLAGTINTSAVTFTGVNTAGFGTLTLNNGTLDLGIRNWGYNGGDYLISQGTIIPVNLSNSGSLTVSSATGANASATGTATINTTIYSGTSLIDVGTLNLGSWNVIAGNSASRNLIRLAIGAVVENPAPIIPLSLGSTMPVNVGSICTASNDPSLKTVSNLTFNGTQLVTSGTGSLTLSNGLGTAGTLSVMNAGTLGVFNLTSGNAGTLVLTSGASLPALTVTPSLAPVPEPTALALVSIGALSLLGRHSRRRR